MNNTLQHSLAIPARILGLLLIITPLALPLAAIPQALRFPYVKLVDPIWTDHPMSWDAWSVTSYYFFNPIFIFPSLIALAVGLWLLLARPSWKSGLTAMVAAALLFFPVLIVLDSMSRGISPI